MTQRPVRLSEVAREAGVSIATASHALSGKGRLPDATRSRVREVAQRMGYRPNVAARSLAGGRTRLIAVAFSLSNALPRPLTDVDYFNHAIRAATARALEHDYALVIAPPTPQTEVWSRLPFDGVVVFDPVEGDPVVTEFRERRVPMVLSGRDPSGGSDYRVDNDQVAGTRTVLDHLSQRGGRRIALLAGDTHDAFTEDTVVTYREWCIERGCEPQVTMVKLGRMSRVAEAARVLEGDHPPDAVYANDELLGVALLRAARRQLLDVPGDLMIAVAADRQPADTPVTLTTLELDAAGTAEQAVDMLIDLLEGRPPAERVRLIPTRLVTGDST
jgi:DNA-binding LacI/PurR family transcriptional regulator